MIQGLAGNDTLEGAAGNDTLDGGLGGDRLRGGPGDDLYIIDNTGDSIAEAADAGLDEVHASVSLVLATNVEDLLLAGALASSGRGNAMANRMTGNGAANLLQGLDGDDLLAGDGGDDRLEGGHGSDELDGGDGMDLLQGDSGPDQLRGGAGSDAFLFRRPSEGGDVLADFSGAAGDGDRFQISAGGFGGGLVAGTALLTSQFAIRADNLAQDADDRFVFRSTDQTLWFDSNGSAAGGLSLVADLQAGATLTYADIVLVA